MFIEIEACAKCGVIPNVSMLGGTNYSFSRLYCKCRHLDSERTKTHLNLDEKKSLINSLIKDWNLKNGA